MDHGHVFGGQDSWGKSIISEQPNGKNMKPWVKGTSEGRLYVDTKHPEWKKWFIEQIEKYSKLKHLKKRT